MAAVRPPADPSFPDRMVNPMFPPTPYSNSNGLSSTPSFPPNGSTPPPSFNQQPYQTRPPIFPPTQQYQPTSMNQPQNPGLMPTASHVYNGLGNPTPPPLFNGLPNHSPSPVNTQSPSPRPTTIRPMYPPASSSAYRPQVQQPQGLYPQANHPNAPPPPPPSTYPQPQYPNSAPTNAYAAQPNSFPQTMPYPMGNNAASPMPPQTNNVNGFASTNHLIDLLKEKTVLSPFIEDPPISPLLNEENQQMNCSPEVMRCSLNYIPQTKDLLNKSRLPFGLLLHPFKDLDNLNVIQGTKIVRCDGCKSYINPFVTFLDNTQWRCSICFRVNALPQEFLFDPMTKTYGAPNRRPEVRFGTVEYAATSDYMARPPQPAMYLFLLDVSHNAIQTGYLQSFCDVLYENLTSLPGDARTQIGFITYDRHIHFYDLTDRQNGNFRVMIAPDLDNLDNKFEDFLPMPDGLMVNISECRTIVEAFLNELPKIYQHNQQTDSVLGTALQIAEKLLHNTGGRVTVVQTRIPNVNPGALNDAPGKEPTVIGPTSDFYKKLSLDYASQQIACDLFLLNSHHIDLATLSGISKYSGGEVKYYPNFHSHQTPNEVERFENDLRRYFQRKIGFEAVMRLRTPPALSIHTFHGNGFVRSVDLLVLPNINPDAAFGMQVAIEDALTQYTTVTFQIALLYTSSKGERRIRVHTLSLPVSKTLTEICANADQEAVVSLIAKMAADRSSTSSLQEAREAISNVACDVSRVSSSENTGNRAFSLMVPQSLRLLPLYMLSMIKSTAFRGGSATKLDDRAYHLELCKTLPIQNLLQVFYPDLYPIHTIEEKSQVVHDGDDDELNIPQRVQLSFQHIDAHGAYIMDASEHIYIYIGRAVSDQFVQNVFNVATFAALPMDSYSLPTLDNPLSTKIQNFLTFLIEGRSHGVAIHVMREDSAHRYLFTRYLVDDKSESTMSYPEFLRYVREQIVK